LKNHGLRVNFGKIEGLLCKICKTRPRVDFGKTEGLLCKMAGKFRPGIIFQRINSWTGSTSLWTGRACSVHREPMAARTEGGWGTVVRSPELGLRPLRCAKAHRQGRKRETGARGAWLGPHRSSGGAVEAGRWCCRTGRQRHSVRTLLRRGERGKEVGEGVVLLGVVLTFYRGRGSARDRWPGRLTPALMALTPLKTGEGLRGKLKEGK
jgi:hypothetical protein